MSSQLYFALHRSWLLIGQDNLPVLWLVAHDGAVVTAAAEEISSTDIGFQDQQLKTNQPTDLDTSILCSSVVVDIKMPDKNIESLLSAALNKVETREQLVFT